MCQPLQIAAVLHIERLVETETMAQLRDLSGRSALAEHLFNWVAWNDMNQQENQAEHQPERRKREQKPLKDVAGHSSVRTRNPPRRLSCF